MKYRSRILTIAMFAGAAIANAQVNADDLQELSIMLEKCEVFSQEFSHPFTGDLLTRNIKGMENDDCVYVEGMPNGGTMTCRFDEESRVAVANFYAATAHAQSIGVKAKSTSDGEGVETETKIDGKSMENPLQDAMTRGDCVVSGY